MSEKVTIFMVRGSNPGEATFSASVQTGPGTHPNSYTVCTGSLSRGLSCQGVALKTHPRLTLWLEKE